MLPKPTATKLRSWRVTIIRKRGQYLGTVEAPNEKAAEAAATAEFDLSDEQRRAARREGAELGSSPAARTNSGDMDFVCDLLARMAVEFNVAGRPFFAFGG